MVKSNCLASPSGSRLRGDQIWSQEQQVAAFAVLENGTGVERRRERSIGVHDTALRQHQSISLAVLELAGRALDKNIAAGVAVEHHRLVAPLDHTLRSGLLCERLDFPAKARQGIVIGKADNESQCWSENSRTPQQPKRSQRRHTRRARASRIGRPKPLIPEEGKAEE